MKWAAIAALLATGAGAESYPSEIRDIGIGQDSLVIEMDGTDRAVVTYHNHERQLSRTGTYTMQAGDIIVDVHIRIGGRAENNREVMTVSPREPYIAIPETVQAVDGETVSIEVMLPMF